jgi:hypothetical protein
MASTAARALVPDDRRRRGAWATPLWLVEHVLDLALDPVLAARSTLDGLRVLDPACGDGRFLSAAIERIRRRFGVDHRAAAGCVAGIEIDRPTALVARRALGPSAEIRTGDALTEAAGPLGSADVVVGNPPFLNQLAADTSRRGRSRWGGGPYADAAVEFLALALAAARPDGGRVGLVLPQSVLATRDAAAARRAALHGSRLDALWTSGGPVFDAAVITVAATFVRGERQSEIRRTHGPACTPMPGVPGDDLACRPTWSHLLAAGAGVPPLELDGSRRLSELAMATAGFRDQFYGLAPYVAEGLGDAPLVTAGLLEPGRCAWGERPARFAGRTFERPGVDLTTLATGDPRLARWVAARRIPKVLVATQTRVLEAAADEHGTWVPSVPVISVEPRAGVDPWLLAAVIGSPVASAWAATNYLGAGLGSGTLKLSASQLVQLPLPPGDPTAAAALLRAGEVDASAAVAADAYGLPSARRDAVLDWWRGRVSASGPRARPPRAGGC